MKTSKKVLSCALMASMLLGITACDGDTGSVSNSAPIVGLASTTPATTVDPDENAKTDTDVKDVDTSIYTPDGNAGTVKWLCYYDIHVDQKGIEQCLVFESEQYGGNIEFITCQFGDAYIERLATLIAADDSPDAVAQDVCMFPSTIARNMFEPLDDYIDINSPMWEGMLDIIESYEYNGKHYKIPHMKTTSYALNYSKKTIEENNLPDPYELYRNGEWTWDAWRDMMKQFCDMSEDNIGFYSTDNVLVSLINTTGATLVEVTPEGSLVSNISDPRVTRAMKFFEDLNREGLTYHKELGDWVPPQTFATNCDRLLFLMMEPEWTYIGATQELQNKPGVENDVFNTVSEFAFVPFPRDVEADKYYQRSDTWGIAVPKGAKNVKGAADMINCFRAYEVDEKVIEQVRQDHINPEPIYYTEGKYAGNQKWQITWGEQEYDLWIEMREGKDLELVTEIVDNGFGTSFWSIYSPAMSGVAFDGESWTQKSAEIAPVIEAALDEYR